MFFKGAIGFRGLEFRGLGFGALEFRGNGDLETSKGQAVELSNAGSADPRSYVPKTIGKPRTLNAKK